MWDKIKAAFRRSLTIAWARLNMVVGVVVGVFTLVLQDPTFQAAVQAAFEPKWVPAWIFVFGLVTELARRRTASK